MNNLCVAFEVQDRDTAWSIILNYFLSDLPFDFFSFFITLSDFHLFPKGKRPTLGKRSIKFPLLLIDSFTLIELGQGRADALPLLSTFLSVVSSLLHLGWNQKDTVIWIASLASLLNSKVNQSTCCTFMPINLYKVQFYFKIFMRTQVQKYIINY